ncbi:MULTISPECIES: hypothetical protein [unclassified Frankia]|uniref:hypothetical protein n=1 Tax=unclassified Frankia TaxID=2632575 RepID=UPI001EF500B8|nr:MULTISPECIES: hypothetical protein [unclassified Frankia]
MPETRMLPGNCAGVFDDVEVVVADPEVFASFIEDAIGEYRLGLESVAAGGSRLHRPNSFGLLGGTVEGDAMVLRRIAFADNVRAVDSVPMEEFKKNIAPKFGKQYDDGERGFWCDSRQLLKVVREFEDNGLEMLGSVHMHPDWHRVGPPHERGTENLSENPSRMDEYLFRNAGWPLNIICYLESREGGVTHTYGAWRPPVSEGAKAAKMPIRFFA